MNKLAEMAIIGLVAGTVAGGLMAAWLFLLSLMGIHINHILAASLGTGLGVGVVMMLQYAILSWIYW